MPSPLHFQEREPWFWDAVEGRAPRVVTRGCKEMSGSRSTSYRREPQTLNACKSSRPLLKSLRPLWVYIYAYIYIYRYIWYAPPQKKKKTKTYLSAQVALGSCAIPNMQVVLRGGVPRTSIGMSVCMCVCLHMAYPFRYRCIWTGLSQGQNCLKIGFHYGAVLINTGRVN